VGSLERKQYSELRRRTIRRAMQPLFRIGDARLAQAGELQADTIRRVLVCRPNHRLGNLLLLTPLLSELARLLPNAEVDIVLAGDHVAELFQAFPNVGHIWNLSRRMVRHPVALGRTIAVIRRTRYDLAIDPCEASQSSRFLMTVAQPRHALGIMRSGRPEGRDTWMTLAPAHMAQWPVHLLRGSLQHAAAGSAREFPTLDIRLTAAELARGRAHLDRLAGVAGHPSTPAIIGVFAEATGAKKYGVDWWWRFIDALRASRHAVTILEISPPDGRARLGGDFPCFSSPSPREVAAVISGMTCFVSADCGVMHLASASGTPTLGLFSASDAVKYAPYGHGSQALLTRGKTPEEVARAASELIGTFAAKGASMQCEQPHKCVHASGGAT
jgi:heptosyltransferase-3